MTEIHTGQFEVERCVWWGKRLRIVQTTEGDIVLCSYEHGTQRFHRLNQTEKYSAIGVLIGWGFVLFLWFLGLVMLLYAV
jgi:hypothetical protein